MREIARSRDLQAELLRIDHAADHESLVRKRRTIDLLGRLVARMHAAGIYHADLHLKNVLLAEGTAGDTLYVLDLDAAKMYPTLSDTRKLMNLVRLYRSVEKLNRGSRLITRTDLLRFLQAYADESSRAVREVAGKLMTMLPLWRLKWKLSDVLGV
jgi:tRNA A-37 threonylcarbamoyl transferase component Bud32